MKIPKKVRFKHGAKKPPLIINDNDSIQISQTKKGGRAKINNPLVK